MNANAETDTMAVDVYQTIYGDRREDEAAMKAADIRGGFGDFENPAEDLTVEDFEDAYQYAGSDKVSELSAMVPRWNAGSGGESEAFLEANAAERARSLSRGDILVTEDGRAFILSGFAGITEVPALEGEVEA